MARRSIHRRLPDWEARLAAWLEAAGDRPHAFGRHDCLVGLAAGVIRAITGVDFARGHRRKYAGHKSAAKYLRGLGFKSPAELLDHHLEARDPAFARRGDLVAGEDAVPGLCLGAVAAFVGDDGLRTEPGPWARAWTVGEA